MSASTIAALLALLTALLCAIVAKSAKDLKCQIWNAKNKVYQEAIKEAGSNPSDADRFHPGPKPDDCNCEPAK